METRSQPKSPPQYFLRPESDSLTTCPFTPTSIWRSSGTLIKVENDILPFHKNGPLDANYEKTSNCGDCMPARVIPNRPRNFPTDSVRAQKIVSVANVTIHSAPTEICAYADKGEEIKQRQ